MEKFFFGDAELLVLNKGDGFSFLGGDVKGMKVEDVIAKLEGTTCGFKDTSCPDQLAKALKQAL